GASLLLWLRPVILSFLLSASSKFFFSSRRRHTRFSRDWSSDVCSSDLWQRFFAVQTHLFVRTLVLVLTFAAVTSLVARLESATLLAAHAILMQLWQLVSHGVDGFAFATETMVGMWLGRGEQLRARASGPAAL